MVNDFEYSKVKQHGDPTKGYVDGHTNLIFGNMYHWELSVEGYWQRVKAGKVAWEVITAVDQDGNFCGAYRRVGPEGLDISRSGVVVHREYKHRVDDNRDENEGAWSEWGEDIESILRKRVIAREKRKELKDQKKKSGPVKHMKHKKPKPKANWIWCRTVQTGKTIVQKKTRSRKKFKRTEMDKQKKREAYWRNQEEKKKNPNP